SRVQHAAITSQRQGQRQGTRRGRGQRQPVSLAGKCRPLAELACDSSRAFDARIGSGIGSLNGTKAGIDEDANTTVVLSARARTADATRTTVRYAAAQRGGDCPLC